MNNKSVFYPRLIQSKLDQYFKQEEVVVLTGMRRVGKTTLLKNLFSKTNSTNKLFFDLEDIFVRNIFSQNNYRDIKLSLEEEGLNFSQKAYVFLDEIQLAPNITSVIKYFFDNYQVKFVVSGSSSFYLKNHFNESLAGRKYVLDLYPLSFQEFLCFKEVKIGSSSNYAYTDQNLSWQEKADRNTLALQDKYRRLYRSYMKYGGFPQVVLMDDKDLKQQILRDIVNSYFQIDVSSLTDFSNISIIRNLLVLLTQRVGHKVSVNNLANTLGVGRQKVYDYLEFLQATYVIKLISQKSSPDNQVSSQDKVYFTDTGLAQIMGELNQGSQLENSVMMNLVNDYDLTYYQTSSGREIDFVVDGEVGLEVKQTVTAKHLSILDKRLKSAQLEKGYVVTLHNNLSEQRRSRVITAWEL